MTDARTHSDYHMSFAIAGRIIGGALLGIALCFLVAMYDFATTTEPEAGWPQLSRISRTWLQRLMVAVGVSFGIWRAVVARRRLVGKAGRT